MDQHAGTAEFGLTIGERRNQGLGSEATSLVLDWAFTVMGLHNILLVTFSWNLPAIRAYSKAGFREIGRRRGAVVTYGQRHDQVIAHHTEGDEVHHLGHDGVHLARHDG